MSLFKEKVLFVNGIFLARMFHDPVDSVLRNRLSYRGYSFIDRTGNNPWNPAPIDYEILIPAKFDPHFNKSLDDICYERVLEAISHNKPLRLFWSGGIDSTLNICNFIKFTDMKFVEIILTMESINNLPESKHFYNDYVIKYPHRIVDSSELRGLMTTDHLIVSGNGAESIFGGTAGFNAISHNSPESFKLPWREFYYDIVDEIEIIIQNALVPIETVYDVHWWIGFNYQWQYALFFNTTDMGKDIIGWEESNFAFYCGDNFQQWALKNYENISSSVYGDSHKNLFKDMIVDFTKDDRYHGMKKFVSELSAAPRNFLAYTASGVCINEKNIKEYINEEFTF